VVTVNELPDAEMHWLVPVVLQYSFRTVYEAPFRRMGMSALAVQVLPPPVAETDAVQALAAQLASVQAQEDPRTH
jgi:hypothetical protein